MKKLLSALVTIAFVAVSAPAFAGDTAAQPGADAPKDASKTSSTSTKKKSTKKTTKTDDKAAAATTPAK